MGIKRNPLGMDGVLYLCLASVRREFRSSRSSTCPDIYRLHSKPTSSPDARPVANPTSERFPTATTTQAASRCRATTPPTIAQNTRWRTRNPLKRRVPVLTVFHRISYTKPPPRPLPSPKPTPCPRLSDTPCSATPIDDFRTFVPFPTQQPDSPRPTPDPRFPSHSNTNRFWRGPFHHIHTRLHRLHQPRRHRPLRLPRPQRLSPNRRPDRPRKLPRARADRRRHRHLPRLKRYTVRDRRTHGHREVGQSHVLMLRCRPGRTDGRANASHKASDRMAQQ